MARIGLVSDHVSGVSPGVTQAFGPLPSKVSLHRDSASPDRCAVRLDFRVRSAQSPIGRVLVPAADGVRAVSRESLVTVPVCVPGCCIGSDRYELESLRVTS